MSTTTPSKKAKPKLAIYWAASCGGCDVAILDTNEAILAIGDFFDLTLWPCAADFKREDVEALDDKEILVTLFNGAIRTSEHEEWAHLLRKKTQIMIAFGACAAFGGIPGLANLTSRDKVLEQQYLNKEGNLTTTVNPEGVLPQIHTEVEEGELELPLFYDTVSSLAQVIPVEYFVPGCPPTVDMILTAVTALMEGNAPPPGTVFGTQQALCATCPRPRDENKKVDKFVRPHEVNIDSTKCFLDQGIMCAGPATRGGCGEICINANVPCRGCFGPAEGIKDQGTKLISVFGSLLKGSTKEEIKHSVETLTDQAGSFYRFTMPISLLRRKKIKEGK
jgi:F420-non-reducing hydrogenase small subunit